MWEYKVGFSLHEASMYFGEGVTHESVVFALQQNNFVYSFEKPIAVIERVLPDLLGKPYKNPSIMQKDAPNAFSCSSFVSYLATVSGLPWMPSITVDKYIFLQEVDRDALEYGDLIFSNSCEGKVHYASIEWRHGTIVPEGVDHVGVYLGNDKVAHSSKSTNGTTIEELSRSASFRNIVGYRRIADLSLSRFCVTIPSDRPDLCSVHNLLHYLAHGEKPGFIRHIHSVKYFSQLLDIQDTYWTNRACGGVCLGMILYSFGLNNLSLTSICNEAKDAGYFTQSAGWYHQGIVDLAKKYGYDGYRTEGGIIDDVVIELKQGALVILSVSKQLFGIKRPHLVLAVGYATDKEGSVVGLYIYDPESLYHMETPSFVPKILLNKDWNKKYIAIKKK